MFFLILSKEASIIFYNLKMRAQLGQGQSETLAFV